MKKIIPNKVHIQPKYAHLATTKLPYHQDRSTRKHRIGMVNMFYILFFGLFFGPVDAREATTRASVVLIVSSLASLRARGGDCDMQRFQSKVPLRRREERLGEKEPQH